MNFYATWLRRRFLLDNYVQLEGPSGDYPLCGSREEDDNHKCGNNFLKDIDDQVKFRLLTRLRVSQISVN